MLTDARRSYHLLYEAQSRPRLYAAPWWLDTVCGPSGWDAVSYRDAETGAMTALPFQRTRIRGLTAITTPPITQWVDVLSDQPELVIPIQPLLTLLPRSPILDLSFAPDREFAFDPMQISLSTRYSYVLAYANPLEEMTAGYNEGLKRNLKQAVQSYAVEERKDPESLVSICLATYGPKNTKAPAWIKALLPGLVDILYKKHQGEILLVHHKSKIIAGALIGWDNGRRYYLSGGRLPGEEGASAHSLLMHHAITQAQKHAQDFDFEGSMVPGIANFFQSFGAHPLSFYQLRKFAGWGKWWSLFH